MTTHPDPAPPDAPVLGLLGEWARQLPDPVVLLGEGGAPGGRILHANPAFREAIGQEGTGLLGRTLPEVLPQLRATRLPGLLDRLRRRARFHRRGVFALALRPDAPPRLWSVEATPIPAAATRPPAPLLLRLRDVTGEHERSRAGARRAEATLDALFAHIPEGLILAEGREGRVRRVSAHGLALSGRAEAALLDRVAGDHATDWGVLRPDGRSPAAAEDLPLARAIRRGETVQDETWVLRRATDGALLPILCSAAPIRDAAGRITGGILVWRDVTHLDRARAALAASEARYRTLADTMPHLVWQTDAAGRPDYMNRRMQGFTGISPAAADGAEALAARIHPEDRPGLTAAWRAARAEGAEFETDARLAAPEGGWRWFRVLGAPVRDASGGVRQWVGTCTDIEDRRRAEAALRAAIAAREALVHAADHRIKNSLQLVASLLRLEAGEMEDAAARAALEVAVARVQAVAEAHHALSRSPDLRTLRLADMLEELAADAARQHPGADLRTEVPPALVLDAERAIPLALVLKELVSRALRHEAAGPGRVTLSAGLIAGEEALEVAVQGRGLAAGPSDRVGETIMGALVRQIGARLAVEAVPGAAEGAAAAMRATLRLPLREAGPPPAH